MKYQVLFSLKKKKKKNEKVFMNVACCSPDRTLRVVWSILSYVHLNSKSVTADFL